MLIMPDVGELKRIQIKIVVKKICYFVWPIYAVIGHKVHCCSVGNDILQVEDSSQLLDFLFKKDTSHSRRFTNFGEALTMEENLCNKYENINLSTY